MLNTAIVGLGRSGKNFVEAVQGKSGRIRFVRGVDAAPDKLRGEARFSPLLRTVATFEAVIKALETGATVEMTG